METKLALFAALLLLSACAAGDPAQRNHAPVPESPSGEYLARTAAELHIVSPGGRIKIDNLEIGNGNLPLVAQTDSPAPAQCPFPVAPAAPAPTANRAAGATPAAGSNSDLKDRPVTEQVERTDAAAAGEYREPEKPGRTLEVPKRK